LPDINFLDFVVQHLHRRLRQNAHAHDHAPVRHDKQGRPATDPLKEKHRNADDCANDGKAKENTWQIDNAMNMAAIHDLFARTEISFHVVQFKTSKKEYLAFC
jgi:hypothetical protein